MRGLIKIKNFEDTSTLVLLVNYVVYYVVYYIVFYIVYYVVSEPRPGSTLLSRSSSGPSPTAAVPQPQLPRNASTACLHPAIDVSSTS